MAIIPLTLFPSARRAPDRAGIRDDLARRVNETAGENLPVAHAVRPIRVNLARSIRERNQTSRICTTCSNRVPLYCKPTQVSYPVLFDLPAPTHRPTTGAARIQSHRPWSVLPSCSTVIERQRTPHGWSSSIARNWPNCLATLRCARAGGRRGCEQTTAQKRPPSKSASKVEAGDRA